MSNQQYLESKVLTAPPQRLHLMLIEGGIRFGRQAEEELRRGNPATATAPLARLVNIVGEMLAGVRHAKGEINKKLADLYWFIFRRASEAAINLDAAALADALKLLEFERETWQKVCERLNAEGRAATSPTQAQATAARKPTAKSGISFQA
jgi:flagellar secretion chaperone FliS